jgi:predicted phosphodiesterase
MKTILAFSCPHLPFEHSEYLTFLVRIMRAYKCTDVVCLGDLVDNHAISYHEHDPNGYSPEREMREVDKKLKEWFKAFPTAYMCAGNHDLLVDRKGRTAGLPSRVFRTLRERLNLPKGWKDDFEFIIDSVKYTHGTGYSGNYAHIQAAYDNRMSCVIGHLHTIGGVEYLANNRDIIFGMAVGCGINKKSYAFEYGKEFKRKPVLGAGIIEYTRRGTNARFVPMELT